MCRNMKNQQKMNEKELSLGLTGTSRSWHREYEDSAWVYIGGLAYELTEGDVICIFSQYVACPLVLLQFFDHRRNAAEVPTVSFGGKSDSELTVRVYWDVGNFCGCFFGLTQISSLFSELFCCLFLSFCQLSVNYSVLKFFELLICSSK